MSYKKIDIINISLIIVIGLFIFLFSYPEMKYLIGWLIGGMVGIIDFLLIRFSLNRPLVIKSKRYTRCKIVRYVMMTAAFVIAVLYPNVSNVICVLLGYMVNKFSIVIAEGFKKGKGSVNKYDDAK